MKRVPTGAIKTLTTLLMLCSFALMLAGPSVIRRPASMSRRAFAARLMWYSGGLGFCAVGALTGAFLIMRREKAAYRERALENMRDLVESTRQARLKKAEEADHSSER